MRRWFQANHGMTFQAYQRARRLGLALGRIKQGDDLTRAAYDHGFESLSGFRDAFARTFNGTPGASRDAEPIQATRLLTPLGPMVAAATDEGICMLEFSDRRMLETQLKRLKVHFAAEVVPGEHEHIARLDDERPTWTRVDLMGRQVVSAQPLEVTRRPAYA